MRVEHKRHHRDGLVAHVVGQRTDAHRRLVGVHTVLVADDVAFGPIQVPTKRQLFDVSGKEADKRLGDGRVVQNEVAGGARRQLPQLVHRVGAAQRVACKAHVDVGLEPQRGDGLADLVLGRLEVFERKVGRVVVAPQNAKVGDKVGHRVCTPKDDEQRPHLVRREGRLRNVERERRVVGHVGPPQRVRTEDAQPLVVDTLAEHRRDHVLLAPGREPLRAPQKHKLSGLVLTGVLVVEEVEGDVGAGEHLGGGLFGGRG